MKNALNALRLGGRSLRSAGRTFRINPNVRLKPLPPVGVANIRQYKLNVGGYWREVGDRLKKGLSERSSQE